MELKTESKIGRIRTKAERLYSLISDCRNWEHIAQNQHISDWTSDQDSCSFQIEKLGDFQLEIVDKQENELVKFLVHNPKTKPATLWIQMKELNPEDTRIKLTTKVDIPMLAKFLIATPMKETLDKLVDKFTEFGELYR